MDSTDRLTRIEERLGHIETTMAVMSKQMAHNDEMRASLNNRAEAMQAALTTLAQNMAVMSARQVPSLTAPVSAAGICAALGTAAGVGVGKALGFL